MVSCLQAEAQVVNQRARVTQNSGVTFTGRITERSDSLLVIWDEISRQDHSILYADMQTLSVSRGVRSYGTTGLIAGFTGGSLAAALFCKECRFWGSALVGAIAAPIGRIVGRSIRREDWATIPIPGQAALRIEPLLGVSLAARPVFGVRLKL